MALDRDGLGRFGIGRGEDTARVLEVDPGSREGTHPEEESEGSKEREDDGGSDPAAATLIRELLRERDAWTRDRKPATRRRLWRRPGTRLGVGH